MGFLGNLYNRGMEMKMEAERDAERMSTEQICEKVKTLFGRAEKMPALSAYASALQRRFNEMQDWELKSYRDELYRKKNAPAYNILKKELQNRGIIE